TGSTHIDATIYHGDGTNCPSSTTIGITAGNGVDWINKGLFTAASSGNLASVFFLDTSTGQIHDYDITDAYGGCSLVADSAVPDMSMTPGSGTQFLTAGTEQDGQALYLFYSGLVGSYHEIYYARVVPNQVLTGPKTVATLTAYTEPSYVTSAQVSSDFIPVMFTRAYSPPGLSDGCTTSWSGWCLYYVGYPLPLNGEASINNPWSNKLGAPLTNDGGGAVSPTTGLLASGQTLIGGTPALPIIYREPGLYYWDGAKDVIYSSTAGYPIVMSGSVTMPGMYYDLPWIDGMVHLQGGQQFPLYQTGKSGSYTWYNNTKGIRYTLVSNGVSAALTFPSGAYIGFIPNFSTNSWTVGTAYPDTTGQNYVTYGYTN